MSDVIKELKERRDRLVDEMSVFTEKRAADDTWTPEDTQKFEDMKNAVADIDARRSELGKAQAEANAADKQREPFAHIVGSMPPDMTRRNQKEREDDLMAFVRGERNAIDVDFRDLELKRERNGTYEVRDLTVGSAAGGGNTVPTTFHRDLYQHLVDASGIRQTNARIITTSDGTDYAIPKTVSHGTAAIVGEGTAIAEADPSFGKVTLGSWKYAELIEVTNELITDSGIELLPYLASQAGRALGLASDADFMTGNGTNKPLGAFAAMGTAVTGATGGTGVPSIANLIDLYYSVAKPYRERGYWVMRDATAAYIRKLAVASTAPEGTWADSLRDGTPPVLLGRPVVTTPTAPALGTPAMPIGFGDWSSYVVRDVKGVRFERSDDFKFNQDMVAFRAILRTDGDLVDLTGALKAFAGPST